MSKCVGTSSRPSSNAATNLRIRAVVHSARDKHRDVVLVVGLEDVVRRRQEAHICRMYRETRFFSDLSDRTSLWRFAKLEVTAGQLQAA